jgi:hypothetical protein
MNDSTSTDIVTTIKAREIRLEGECSTHGADEKYT